MMGSNRPQKLATWLDRGCLPPAVEGAETTRIPVDGAAGHYGAAAYFAVVCHPGIDPRSHERRNQLTAALFDYIRGIIKYRAGYTRVTRRRAAAASNTWLSEPARMKNDTVFAVCNRAEKILREQRLPCAWIASQLTVLHWSEQLKRQNSKIQFRLGGPQRLTGLIESAAETSGLAEPRTMWRYWNATLPVLHLATAFHFLQPKQQAGDRPQLMVRCTRDHRLWLASAVASAESRARYYLPLCTAFDPAKRICLVPE